MASVNQTSKSTVQARVFRNGVVWQKAYRIANYKSLETCMRQARIEANREEKKWPKVERKSKSNTGIRGISRCGSYDKRRGKIAHSYGIHYKA